MLLDLGQRNIRGKGYPASNAENPWGPLVCEGFRVHCTGKLAFGTERESVQPADMAAALILRLCHSRASICFLGCRHGKDG